MEILQELEAWHWFVLAIILLGAETLGLGGFLIGSALAAFTLFILSFIAPDISWQNQLLIFSLLALTLSVAYWKFFKPFNQHTDKPDINNRAKHMIGRKILLEQDLDTGEGRVHIGDTLWQVRCTQALNKGDMIQVVDYSEAILLIEKI